MFKVSVLVPAYNAEKYIIRCLESIINQTFQDYELVIIDDGSSDNTLNLIEKFSEGIQNVKVFHQENKGISATRNKLVELATSEWICFVDADDYISPYYLETLLTNAEKYEADLSIVNYIRTDKDSSEFVAAQDSKTYLGDKYQILEAMTVDFRWVVPWGKLIRRDLFEGNMYPNGRIHEDEAVTYKLIYKAKRIVINDRQLYYYSTNQGSITQTKFTEKRFDLFTALEERIAFFSEKKENKLEEEHSILLLTQLWRYYSQALEQAEDETIPTRLFEYYKRRFEEVDSKYRISYFQNPELYILIYPKIAWLSKLLYKIKRKIKIVFHKNRCSA